MNAQHKSETTQSNQRQESFEKIKSYFNARDLDRKKNNTPLHFDTRKGIWGPSDMDHVFELFTRMHLENYPVFIDVGSGDGRVALIASLFTTSYGIEIDEELISIANDAARLLSSMPTDQTKKVTQPSCTFIIADYESLTYAEYPNNVVLFTFQDRTWNVSFEKKLLQECNGILLSYRNIFTPNILKKGRTYWMNGQPITAYYLNQEEQVLF